MAFRNVFYKIGLTFINIYELGNTFLKLLNCKTFPLFWMWINIWGLSDWYQFQFQTKWKRVGLEKKMLRRRNSSLYIHLHSSKATFWWHKGSVKDKQLKSSSCQCLCGCLGIPKFPPQKKDWRPKKGKRAFTTLQRNYVEAANTPERRKRGGGTIRWSLARKLIIHSSLPFLEQIHSFSFLSYMTL